MNDLAWPIEDRMIRLASKSAAPSPRNYPLSWIARNARHFRRLSSARDLTWTTREPRLPHSAAPHGGPGFLFFGAHLSRQALTLAQQGRTGGHMAKPACAF